MKFVQSLLFMFLLIFLSSCGGNETPEEMLGVVDPSFEVGGTWYFKTVSGKGTISGVPTEDDRPRSSFRPQASSCSRL